MSTSSRCQENVNSLEYIFKPSVKFCFVIPTYPKHYDYIYDFIDKCIFDVWLVFSTQDDYELFKFKDHIKYLIIPENVTTDNIVTYKKFYALRQLTKSTYKYIIVCDSEIRAIPKNLNETNIISKIDNIFINEKIYAGVTNGFDSLQIMETSANVFSEENIKILKQKSLNYHLYSWWSDIPVYNREHLQHFLEVIGEPHFVFGHYDHIMYQYYLILYKNFQFFNISNIINHWWSLESHCLKCDELEKLCNDGYQCCWTSRFAYISNKLFYDQHGTFLQYHLDRNVVSTLRPLPMTTTEKPFQINISELALYVVPGLVDWKIENEKLTFNTIKKLVTSDRCVYIVLDSPNLNIVQWLYSFGLYVSILHDFQKIFGKIKIVLNDTHIFKLILLEYFGTTSDDICLKINDMNNLCVFPNKGESNIIDTIFNNIQQTLKHDKEIYNVFMCQNDNTILFPQKVHCNNPIIIQCISDTPLSLIVKYLNNSKNIVVFNHVILFLFCPFMCQCNIIFISDETLSPNTEQLIKNIERNNKLTIVKSKECTIDELTKLMKQ